MDPLSAPAPDPLQGGLPMQPPPSQPEATRTEPPAGPPPAPEGSGGSVDTYA